MITIEEMENLLKEIKAGKKWQFKSCAGDWILAVNQSIPALCRDIFNGYEIRIAPEPKMRLMKPDEFPAVWWFLPREGAAWFLVTTFREDTFECATFRSGKTISYDMSDFPSGKWSSDRKTIHSFYVEDKS